MERSLARFPVAFTASTVSTFATTFINAEIVKVSCFFSSLPLSNSISVIDRSLLPLQFSEESTVRSYLELLESIAARFSLDSIAFLVETKLISPRFVRFQQSKVSVTSTAASMAISTTSANALASKPRGSDTSK